jgi:hypothetical protein
MAVSHKGRPLRIFAAAAGRAAPERESVSPPYLAEKIAAFSDISVRLKWRRQFWRLHALRPRLNTPGLPPLIFVRLHKQQNCNQWQ